MDTVWRLIESYHAPVYFAEERFEHYTRAGLKGGWMGYFASRAAALGPVGPEVVAALFYNFAPPMVAKAIPDAWRYSTPERVLGARDAVFDAAARRLLGSLLHSDELTTAAALAVAAVRAADPSGRPLFAAHAALDTPHAPHMALFWATSALREFRGDGHNSVLLGAGVDGCEANLLMVGLGLAPSQQRTFRGWTEEQWLAASERLQQRGWLDESGVPTQAGRAAREEIEARTDRLAAPALDVLGKSADDLAVALRPLVERIVAVGAVSYPNAIGLPPVPA